MHPAHDCSQSTKFKNQEYLILSFLLLIILPDTYFFSTNMTDMLHLCNINLE